MFWSKELLDVRSMLKYELEEKLLKLGLVKYRASQVYSWAMAGVDNFDNMSNIPLNERKLLNQHFFLENLKIERVLTSSQKDKTKKYLFKLGDGNFIESVLMKYRYGYTACISTQVGCKMGCKFCTTGIDGFVRNLTPGEMVEQIQKMNFDNSIRVSHVVLMGMGEPLDNYKNVVKFLKILSDGYGLKVSKRNVSLSTCGVVNKIYDLSEENFALTLSVSLHASNDEVRRKIMPISKKFPMNELLVACQHYINKTKRRISFEYTLISGINDSPDHALELAKKIKGMLCHVNLIGLSMNYKNSSLVPSKEDASNRFRALLLKKGVNVTVRRSLGSDINASCGQLRTKCIQ